MTYSQTCAECKNPFADGELVSMVKDGRVYHHTKASAHGEPQKMPIGCKDKFVLRGNALVSDSAVFYGGNFYDATVVRAVMSSGEVKIEFNPTKTATKLTGNLEIIAQQSELRL